MRGSAHLPDGNSLDELLAVGTRKAGFKLPMSATDINRAIPFEVAVEMQKRMDGFTEDELKHIGEHKIAPAAPVSAQHINEMPVQGDLAAIENVLAGLQRFLGIRTK